ncbi:hypothetical protein A3K48_00485 [candidate division WOR-1 bacterium RIFOXYA12_FULL_52_29]|uniref:Ribosomal RNA small subunit methyltransferase E n=1 Tax=candidate division WOR-1 bacterium RIFOXYC12_FULL_54_18 TaxID=1802584 RepID=A0A1F4T4K5_UNCSA|nr:MAG: hypothetical protein A3K44_00485 [candidate division WOR-1 bacterium RIFOXYA2_FULL_51_19]OGC17079.1 MAG: hypothetical protein A3K48_00485 [candidate division WOR-1 bacterium RIFOXYA12_FULL_52_29]OGC25940.1 MAG: hypothetical protein A3K32_00485 [candidate division WOR-1 bacterium RIFOXYB2_FULL_45_9]OGC27496.1 MAG: hypothetical protein A3K49_00485 [candidate division WOR-1 bacterium RIFOXYC12_FULL_54_18]OGC29291.1 MAG: hypothetical protein A2346_01220 [candidate division WOR-1 bacterium R
MHRLFVPKEQFPNITGSDLHYVKDVIRLKPGDDLELFDGHGFIYRVKIEQIGKEIITTRITERKRAESELKVKVTLAQALAKGQKMDFIVEKCTELGVASIIPMLTERTIPKQAKLDRWKKLAKEAAEQSGRGAIPEIFPPLPFEEVLKLGQDHEISLIPWELEKSLTLKDELKGLPASILLLIGPEGGFSRQEIDLAIKNGFKPITLGKRILRSETAGLASLAAIGYELG